MSAKLSRREMLGRSPLVAGACLATLAPPTAAAATAGGPASEPFRYCLNTGTLRGHKLDIVAEVEIAAKAGYGGIEPWIDELKRYVQEGGSLKVLNKRIADSGLTVEGAIGFSSWINNDPDRRAAALEEIKRSMDTVRAIGGHRIAAPPAGEGPEPIDLQKVTERYGKLLDLGQQMEVVPQLEIWGASRSLSRLGQVTFVAIETGHPLASLLLDVYHIYKGGSSFEGLNLINGESLLVLHVNDYPATPSREEMNDSHRIYPGDGIAPLADILHNLYLGGFRGALSLELFNRDYWKQNPLEVARTGLQKTLAVVQKSLAS
jgi:2-keto-myo-inositol isomerase